LTFVSVAVATVLRTTGSGNWLEYLAMFNLLGDVGALRYQ
jgi:hypothetical protein